MAFTMDGGNWITTIYVDSYTVQQDETQYRDRLFLFRWIKNNVDDNAQYRNAVDTMCMYSIDFMYNDKNLSMTVMYDDKKHYAFTLLSPVQGIEEFYTFIRNKLDSSTIITNKKKEGNVIAEKKKERKFPTRDKKEYAREYYQKVTKPKRAEKRQQK